MADADTHKNLEDDSNPRVTMKPKEHPEDSKTDTTGKEKNEEVETSDEFEVCSPGGIPSTNPFATSSSQNKTATRGILKPPQLSLNTNTSTKPFVLNASRLNPFAGPSIEISNDLKNIQITEETPKFVPLLQSESKKVTSSQPTVTTNTTPTSDSFIFGQNLQDRVLSSDTKSEEPSTSLNSNGTTEMLFTSAVKSEIKTDGNSSNKETKSLSESAKEYEEARAVKRKYEEVEVITGEENETNILHIHCKLFAFDKTTGSWQERGRGVLRLNDFDRDGHIQSRVVFRTLGIWKVILNTKIWAEMTVEQASEKSVRFTALDTEGVAKVFLAMASIEDSKQLCSQIKSRVQQEIEAQKHKKSNVETDSGSK